VKNLAVYASVSENHIAFFFRTEVMRVRNWIVCIGIRGAAVLEDAAGRLHDATT
jgi:hypothetical protein